MLNESDESKRSHHQLMKRVYPLPTNGAIFNGLKRKNNKGHDKAMTTMILHSNWTHLFNFYLAVDTTDTSW